MKRYWRMWSRLCWSLLLVWSMSGCVNDEVPLGSTMSVNPENRTIEITEFRNSDDQCIYDNTYHVDLPVLLYVQDSQGSPVGNLDINVYVDFTSNTFTGYPVLALYKDLNGNGVVDGPQELVSGLDDPVTSIRTAADSGEAFLMLRTNLSCAFRGELFAYAGIYSARATVEVRAAEVVISTDESPTETDAIARDRRQDEAVAFGPGGSLEPDKEALASAGTQR